MTGASVFFSCAVLAASVAGAKPAQVCNVSPKGLSPHQAVLKIREAKAKGDTGAWTVRVAPGFYSFDETLVLTPEDSGTPAAPVRWIADGNATFAGGRRLGDWRDDGDGTWSAPVPTDASGKPVWFQSLYVNGRRAVRARQPNAAFFGVSDWRQEAVTNADGTVEYFQKCVIKDPAADALNGLSADDLAAGEFQCRVKWTYGAFRLCAWDAVSRTLTVSTRAHRIDDWAAWKGKHDAFCLENLRTGFDAPGEWFYDRANGRVRYRPQTGERLEKIEALAPTAQLVSVLRFEGDPVRGRYVSDLSFENLVFALSRTDGDRLDSGFVQQYQYQAACGTGGCVSGRGMLRVTFDGCRVNQTENYGVWMDVGCVSNRIANCELKDLGAGGVWMGDTEANYFRREGEASAYARPGVRVAYGDLVCRQYHPCAFNTVDNCEIVHAGQVNPEGCGVVLTHVCDTSVTHCEIHDLYYTGVSVGWTWGYSGSLSQRNTIAFNRIYDLGKNVMSDMGGVYTLGTSFGTCISNNVIHTVRSSGYGGWGLYNDEGSEGIVWENNLVYDTKDASYHQHYGRDNVVRNNILACSEKCQLAISRPEEHRSVTFERNIVYWDYDGAVYREPMWMKGIVTGKAKADWKDNVFWCGAGPTVVNAAHPAIVCDPLFVDAKARNFRLKPESPAVRYGFKPWDISLSGLLVP